MKKNNVARHRFAGQSLSPLLPHGAGLLLLVLLVVAIVSLRQSTPVSNAATVSATSPHYSHINILDFGRAVRWLPYGSIRTEGYRWYAQHVDVMETQMDNATFSGGDTTSTYIKSLNPSIKTFGYDYDLTMCQHEHCDHTQPPHSLFTNLPEEYYLHFSQDTQVQFTDHLGNSMGSATITGCPAPQPITSACRVSIFIWNDNRWIVNLKSVAWQQWFADHLVNELTVNSLGQTNPVDGLFLDEHGNGISLTMSIGYNTVITSGGGIREYGGVVPRDYNISGYGNYDNLDSLYNADVVTWLTYLHSRLAAVGKYADINVGEGLTEPFSLNQALALKGVQTEINHRATEWRNGAVDYQKYIDTVHQVIQAGGFVDLAGTWCDNGPPQYTAGSYPSAPQRFFMWNLASYYIAKELPSETGTAYFDPNLCIQQDSATPLSFEDEWLKAYETNVGLPQGAYTVAKQGTTSCSPIGYKIFSRQYDNALVLVRPKDYLNCNDYSDATAVSVPLASPMSKLNPDGTLSAAMSSVSIRNAEAVIMMTPPDTTPPAGVTDLQARAGSTTISVGAKNLALRPFGAAYRGKLWAKKIRFRSPDATWYLLANRDRSRTGAIVVYSSHGKLVKTLRLPGRYATQGWHIDIVVQPKTYRVFLAAVPVNGGRRVLLYEVTAKGVTSRGSVVIGKSGQDVTLRFLKRTSTDYGLAAMVTGRLSTRVMYRFVSVTKGFVRDAVFNTKHIVIKNSSLVLH